MTGRLRRQAGGGARDGLLSAAIAGLVAWPDVLEKVADRLAGAPLADARIDALLDAVDDSRHGGQPLETARLRTILAERGLATPSPEDYAMMRFGFLAADFSGDGAPDQARAELAQAVGLLVERPALEHALADATARFERDLSEGAFAEQQRLLQRKLEFDERLRHMASARAASPSRAAPNLTAE